MIHTSLFIQRYINFIQSPITTGEIKIFHATLVFYEMQWLYLGTGPTWGAVQYSISGWNSNSSHQNSFAHNLFPSQPIFFKLVSEHRSDTVMLCAKFQNDSANETNVMHEKAFVRFEFKMSFRRISCGVQPHLDYAGIMRVSMQSSGVVIAKLASEPLLSPGSSGLKKPPTFHSPEKYVLLSLTAMTELNLAFKSSSFAIMKIKVNMMPT